PRFPFCCLSLFRRCYASRYKTGGVVCLGSHLPHACDSMSLCLSLIGRCTQEGLLSPCEVSVATPMRWSLRHVSVSHPCCVSGLKGKPPRQMDPAGLRAGASQLAGNRCTDRPGNTPLGELKRNRAGELLHHEGPKHRHPQRAPDLATGGNHGRAQISAARRRGGENVGGQWAAP